MSTDSEAERIAMTAADKLIQKGHEKGIQKGIQKGERIGQIRLLEKLLGCPQTSSEEIQALETIELEAMFEKLDTEYVRRFKNH